MKNCPNCGNRIICELQLDQVNNKSYLHEYCDKCGYDKSVDDFNEKYRQEMSKFCLKIRSKVGDKGK